MTFSKIPGYIMVALFVFISLSYSPKDQGPASTKLIIVKKWDLPPVLKEISGIDCIDKQRFACVQDEAGKIFIYNVNAGSIEKEIYFAPPADYEGITLVNTTAYMMHANGEVMEVKNYNAKNLSTVAHKTFLSTKENVEGICFEPKKYRLLLSVKKRDPFNNDFKGIYAFDLSTKKLAPEPVYKINTRDDIWKGQHEIEPSDLAVHPGTGNIYVLDGEHPRLLVMTKSGSIKKIYQLDDPAFSLPEGICFSKTGELFISNEGRSGAGNILQVREE